MTDRPESRKARLEAIAERHAKATPGEWAAEPMAGRGAWIGVPLTYAALSCGNTDVEAQRNAHFIAHAHQDIPFLLSDNARLESELTQAQEQLRRCAEVMREAARELEMLWEYQGREFCEACVGEDGHAPDCLVSRLRGAAEKAGGQ